MEDLKVYVYFDKIAGIYSMPVVQMNDGVMKRIFNSGLKSVENSTDYELWCIGTYNQSLGKITLLSEKEFICRGGEI